MKSKILICTLIYLLSIPPFFAISSQNSIIHRAYRHAVRDASIVEKGEIAEDLISITPENEQLVWNTDKTKVLVASWKSKNSYERFLKSNTQTAKNEAYIIWVTTVPQVQKTCQRYLEGKSGVSQEEIDLRLKQYLGLNPTWQYDVFVEMWVSPKDLFRPCVDPEVVDSKCNLNFGDTAPAVKGIKNYPSFYKNLYYSDFRTLPGVPWTGLGYTFDWGNPLTDQGASEFILVPGAAYEIHRVVTTMEYCKSGG